MEARIWGQDAAPCLILLHLLLGVLLLGASTHHLMLVLRRQVRARPGLVARYALWTTIAYVSCFLLGVLIYPTYNYHVRHIYLDAAAPWATGLFEIKEHWLAVGLGILPWYYVSSRTSGMENPKDRRFHALSVIVLGGIVWYSFIVGAVVANLRGV